MPLGQAHAVGWLLHGGQDVSSSYQQARYIIMGRLDTALQYCLDNTRWYVYLICDEFGKPAYVGATAYPEKRYAAHLDYRQNMQGKLREWLAINPHSFEVLDSFPTRRMMLDAEHEYIAYLDPMLNVAR